MSALVLDKVGAGLLASFGSGDPPGSSRNPVNARAAGRGGRQTAPAGATRSLLSAARRQAAAPGRGRAARQQLLRQIESIAVRPRGGPRMSNADVRAFRERLRDL